MTQLVVKSIEYPQDRADFFNRFVDLPWAAWLDSGEQNLTTDTRYDIITAAPAVTLVTQKAGTQVTRQQESYLSQENPFELLKQWMPAFSKNTDVTLPFVGGALGFWSYDLVHAIENGDQSTSSIISQDSTKKTGCQPKARWHDTSDTNLPLMAVGLYDWSIVLDHAEQKAFFCYDAGRIAAGLFEEIEKRISLPHKWGRETKSDSNFKLTSEFQSNLTPSGYKEIFDRVIDYLHSGDCYQINLAQRFKAQYEGDALLAYTKLRAVNPAPFSAFLRTPFGDILSMSPECFIKVDGKTVTTYPIKGTRPRDANPQLDQQGQQDLLSHPKDRAENLMIVDLLRNDLGKSCVPGSIRVEALFALKSYASVHHLVSTISGQLAAHKNSLDVLADCFPGGSITGAPKKRAIEIIASLEPHQRTVYCGSIGYIGYNGNMNTNIGIRTLLCQNNAIYCWAGGGIVADSTWEKEYQETLDKVAIVLQALANL